MYVRLTVNQQTSDSIQPSTHTSKQWSWNCWLEFLQSIDIDGPYISEWSQLDQASICAAFAETLRTGDYKSSTSRPYKPLCTVTINTSFRHVAVAFTCSGKANPTICPHINKSQRVLSRLSKKLCWYQPINATPTSHPIWTNITTYFASGIQPNFNCFPGTYPTCILLCIKKLWILTNW